MRILKWLYLYSMWIDKMGQRLQKTTSAWSRRRSFGKNLRSSLSTQTSRFAAKTLSMILSGFIGIIILLPLLPLILWLLIIFSTLALLSAWIISLAFIATIISIGRTNLKIGITSLRTRKDTGGTTVRTLEPPSKYGKP